MIGFVDFLSGFSSECMTGHFAREHRQDIQLLPHEEVARIPNLLPRVGDDQGFGRFKYTPFVPCLRP